MRGKRESYLRSGGIRSGADYDTGIWRHRSRWSEWDFDPAEQRRSPLRSDSAIVSESGPRFENGGGRKIKGRGSVYLGPFSSPGVGSISGCSGHPPAATRLMNSILVIQLKRLGDVILTTPALAELRTLYPQAHI